MALESFTDCAILTISLASKIFRRGHYSSRGVAAITYALCAEDPEFEPKCHVAILNVALVKKMQRHPGFEYIKYFVVVDMAKTQQPATYCTALDGRTLPVAGVSRGCSAVALVGLTTRQDDHDDETTEETSFYMSTTEDSFSAVRLMIETGKIVTNQQMSQVDKIFHEHLGVRKLCIRWTCRLSHMLCTRGHVHFLMRSYLIDIQFEIRTRKIASGQRAELNLKTEYRPIGPRGRPPPPPPAYRSARPFSQP
ncbi:hypothetical protein EVAR_43199_1 [Eumeta japonica]|uniref:Uncharacterized protein n=1 Tax=Eumeta variegata TaxID=151549 RepID=A0A4C1WVT3_EUMVA|nr:hypothetical protein EVAR_43199_1 [Eumeta japonica]